MALVDRTILTTLSWMITYNRHKDKLIDLKAMRLQNKHYNIFDLNAYLSKNKLSLQFVWLLETMWKTIFKLKRELPIVNLCFLWCSICVKIRSLHIPLVQFVLINKYGFKLQKIFCSTISLLYCILALKLIVITTCMVNRDKVRWLFWQLNFK